MTAAIKSKWPHAVANYRNSDLVPIDGAFMYHQPGVNCRRLHAEASAQRARTVSLARALVWCDPCSCWLVTR